jgi:hypothetical protein
MPTLSPTQLLALKTLVVGVFTQPEFEQLTLKWLGQRLDVIASLNQPFDAVVFDVVNFVDRQGATEEFVRGVYEERKGKAEVVQFCQANYPLVFTPRASNTDLAQAVSKGLAAVATNLSGDGKAVRDILVSQAGRSLELLGTEFTRLRKYKVLHDCLHNLQFKYTRVIDADLKLFMTDPEVADTLDILFKEMAGELAQAQPETAGLESEAAERLWLNLAGESIRRMQAAVTAREPRSAAEGFQLLESLLRVQPTRINELLTGLLERLALDQLRTTLQAIRQPAPVDTDPLLQAATALGSLSPRLKRILAEHKEWQVLDNYLQQIDNELKFGSACAVSEFLWSQAAEALAPILGRDEKAAWSQELLPLAVGVAKAFSATQMDKVKEAFRRFRPRAMWYFYQADRNLKELSASLDKIGEVLDHILQEVRHGMG